MNAKLLCERIQEIGIIDSEALYLLDAISNSAGFFTTQGKLVYFALDCESSIHESIETEFLVLHTHIRIRAVCNYASFPDDDYNLLLYKGSPDDQNVESFVHLCNIHARERDNLRFKDFFYSLIDLFKLPTEQEFKNAVGLYGELKLMQLAYTKYNTDISPYWHKQGSYSRHDFSSGQFSIEVKTIIGNEVAVMIKHLQVFGDTPCVIAVVNCERNDAGESLSEIITELQETNDAFRGINFAFNIAAEQKRISRSDMIKLRFKVVKLQLYNSSDINPFSTIPSCITDLSYRLDITDEFPIPEAIIEPVFHRLLV